MTRRRQQAIVFDLDDTLYRERRFALSGYAAVARFVEREYGHPARVTFGLLASALRSGRRAAAFQSVCATLGLDRGVVSDLIQVHRTHRPALRLSAAVTQMVRLLGRDWALGLLTNGPPHVQRRKVEALGLGHMMDAIVFAAECVAGGKPHPTAFETVVRRLGVAASRTVFVGDDAICDIDGARAVGLRTIQIVRTFRGIGAQSPLADAIVKSVTEVATVAPMLVTPESPRAGTGRERQGVV
jgi:putative hydrolase of the HAD superfamily